MFVLLASLWHVLLMLFSNLDVGDILSSLQRYVE